MADEPQGLDAPKEESSVPTRDELFSGSLESPEGTEDVGSEPPATVEPEQSAKPGDGKSTIETEDSDPELSGIFTDLEKDIPEALKQHAMNVKKKLQGYFTKKNQTVSQELETLRKNQITDDIKQSYSTMYGWYDKIQQNPQAGLKELASQFGVSVEALVAASVAETPGTTELTQDQLVTREDYAAFARQEARKAMEEIREKEVKPLREDLAKRQAFEAKRGDEQRGAAMVQDAADNLPGFLNDKKEISKEGNEAIARVLNGEFIGPNAVKNAFRTVMSESSISKVKELEAALESTRKNAAGASNPPGSTTTKTTVAPSRPENLWEDLRKEPLI